MKIRVFRLVVLLATLWACRVCYADACGIPEEVAAGNRVSAQIFAAHVKRPRAAGAPSATKPAGYVQPESYGARGDGAADDTSALQEALDRGKQVWLGRARVYRITRSLALGNGARLASDGTATILMAKGDSGFSNRTADFTDAAIYGSRGVGLRLNGRDIALRDFSLVKEYEDERYVIGIDIRASEQVSVDGVSLRGFSLAPGIINLRSSRKVDISNSLIHASCTRSATVPANLPLYQITGILIDDAKINGEDSASVHITNNVITDLVMERTTYRGDQTDGINYHISRRGTDLRVADNYIGNVAEGIDTFAANLLVEGNEVSAKERGIKLIHGARDSTVRANVISVFGKHAISAIGLFTATPEVGDRQVRNITISGNVADNRFSDKPGIYVEEAGKYPPVNIKIEGNRFLVNACALPAIICNEARCAGSACQCTESNNTKWRDNVFACQ